MRGFPKDFKRTGKKIMGMEVGITETVPNCRYSFVMSGKHAKTGETGWYTVCKKTGKLDKFGPYRSIYDAIHALILARGCDECEFNQDDDKGNYLQKIDSALEEQVKSEWGEDYILNKIDRRYVVFYENRMFLDSIFKSIFGVRLFTSIPDDSLGPLELVKPCQNRSDFVDKIQILAGVFDRINPEVKKLIKLKNKDYEKKSIMIIEQILKENKPDYNTSIISNLRNLMNLRSKLFPTHATGSKLIMILNNFGISIFPPDDWEATFLHIFDIISISQKNLLEELQQISLTRQKPKILRTEK